MPVMNRDTNETRSGLGISTNLKHTNTADLHARASQGTQGRLSTGTWSLCPTFTPIAHQQQCYYCTTMSLYLFLSETGNEHNFNS